jgi:hypothetical protein
MRNRRENSKRVQMEYVDTKAKDDIGTKKTCDRLMKSNKYYLYATLPVVIVLTTCL